VAFAVRVEGWDEFVRDLRRLGETEALKEIRAELRPVAQAIAADAARRAPRRSGRLAGSIRAGVRRGAPAVVIPFTQVPYSKIHEFGGRHPVFGNRDVWVAQNPRPFVGPAVDANREMAARAVEAALNKALTRAGWD
jgi:HK97 gp10 family phage protein